MRPLAVRANRRSLICSTAEGICEAGPVGDEAAGLGIGSLADYLVGSPFIHQTTVSMRKAFEQAKRSAPSLLILEEIDAVAPARGPMSHDHKVEELTEILRMIESAAKNGILVLATTNRKEALDPALLRKGRFDHSLHVDYPTKEEVELALQGMLKDRPHDLPDLSKASRFLAGRPMSDTAWVVNEAARLTARSKEDRIREKNLDDALSCL